MVGFCLSTGRRTGASSMRYRRFPGAKGSRLHFSNTVDAEFTGPEPSRLQHLECTAEEIYLFRIANVNKPETRLIDEWGCFQLL